VPQYPHDRGYALSREQAMADFKAQFKVMSAAAADDVKRHGR
jgi:hypothetical protein